MERFLARSPQLEEEPQEYINIPKVIQGHGVDFDTLILFRHAYPNMLCIFRDPVSHFYSRFNHWSNFRTLLGYDCSLESFMEEDFRNFQSSRLIGQFSPLTGPNESDEEYDALNILGKFKYVFATERLDTQVTGLFQQLRIPSTMDKRRVASDKSRPDITPAEIAERNPLDYELYEHIRDHQYYSDANGSFNPFGFDKKSLQNILREKWRADNPKKRKLSIEKGYIEMVNTLGTDRRLEVAQEMLRHEKCHWVTQPKLLETLVEEAWSEFMASDPNNEALSVSTFRLARYFQHHRQDIKTTMRLFERSLDYWPNSPMTLVYYGDILVAIGKKEAGLQMIAKALELEPRKRFIRDIAARHLAN